MNKNIKIGMFFLVIVFLILYFQEGISEYVFAAKGESVSTQTIQESKDTSSEDIQKTNKDLLIDFYKGFIGYFMEESNEAAKMEENKEIEKEVISEEVKAKNQIYKIENKIFYKGNTGKNKIAITFDDGPNQYYNQRVLDILEQYNVEATFFVVGKHIQKDPQGLKDISSRGHEIGSHSFSHKNFNKLNYAQIQEELTTTEQLIHENIGSHTNLFRPPYGAIKNSLGIVNSLGYNVINWSVDTRDWSGISAEEMLGKVKNQLNDGGIILMHSSGSEKAMGNMLTVLPQIIEWARTQGYEFTTVSKLLELQELEI